MKKKVLLTSVYVVFALGLFFVFEACKKSRHDYTEYFTGYDDRISYIVEGYQMHWEGFSPENLDLSYIYSYESPYGGFVKYDLDGDGTEELLMGDQFENGDYQIYDIFTFDKSTGNIIHLFCGGERNWCTMNGSGVIIETGSISAEDSFTKYYVLKDLKLKKLKRNQPITKDILVLDMDKFINYAIPPCGGYTEQHELTDEDIALFRNVMGESLFSPLSVATQVVAGLNYRFWCRYDDGCEDSPAHCSITIYQPLQGEPAITNIADGNGGPEMKVIIDDTGTMGRYISENETSYIGEIQDEYQIEKDKASTTIVKACEGRGILTLKDPGKKSAFELPDAKAEVIGTLIHEEGYIPEVYNCLGYIKGWFLAEIDGKTGFIQEEFVIWDAVNSF